MSVKNINYEWLEGKQFAIIWKYDGKIWGDTFTVKDGKLLFFNNMLDEFEEACFEFMDCNEQIKMIIEE